MSSNCISIIEKVYEMFRQSSIAYGHGTDNAWDEAVYLVTSVADLADDESSASLKISDRLIDQILGFAERRINERLPLAYLLGFCEYAGHRFILREGVIIPRSPIGHLLLDGFFRPWEKQKVSRVLDLCSGTGCLGILAAYRYRSAEVILIDNDPLAIEVAKKNIELHGMTNQVRPICADVTKTIEEDLGLYDLILCNPPYVDQVDMESLSEEFKKEPSHALDGGVDGLSILRPVIEQAQNLLADNGVLVCEAGASAAAFNKAFEKFCPIALDTSNEGEGVFLLEGKSLQATS